MAVRFVTTPDVALEGDLDVEVTIRDTPAEFTTKGMFFNRYVAALGAEWEEILPSLEQPAKHGRYHAFESYPLRDYLRVLDRVARARFPGSSREAFRVLARGEVEVFSESTLGKVTFSLVRGPAAALLRFPEFVTTVTRSSGCSAHGHGERRVVVTYPRFHGAIEHGLGLMEGLVQTYDEKPRVDVTVRADRHTVFDVTW